MSERRPEGFDRIKPPERRIMERLAGERLDDVGADPAGRAALFTRGAGGQGTGRGAREQEGHGRGGLGLAVGCSRCDETTALDVGTALRAALPIFLVLPWRADPIFALCPACGHRAWMRLVEPPA